MRLLRVMCTLTALVLFTLPAAAIDRWTLVGPDTASVLSLAAAPSRPTTVYAGLTAGGVYRSTDAGQTWTWASGGLSSFDYVNQLAVAPASPDTVYAVVSGLRLYKTTTGGGSWQLLLQPDFEAGSPGVYRVAVHPRDARIVYALSLEGPVRRSADGGVTWTDLPAAPENTALLRIDPVHPNVLYAAVVNGPLWKSTDEGRTWRQIGEGLGPAPRIRSLEIDPRSSQVLYLTRWNNGPSLFQSRDGGETWTPLARDLDNAPLELLGIAPRGAQLTLFGTAYANGGRRLYRSLDGGLSWSEAGKGLRSPIFRISPVAATAGAILAPTFEGVFRSADGGRSWVPSSRNLKATRIESLARGSALYAGVPGQGIYESSGRQAGWRLLPMDARLAEDFLGTLAVHPREPGRLYAGTYLGIARSEDRGASWEVSDSGCLTADEIVTDPVDPDTLYITGRREPSGSCRSPSGIPACALQKSEDGGRTFNCSQRGLPQEILSLLTIDPLHPSTLLVRAQYDLYRSTDGGDSWNLLAPFDSALLAPHALAFDPREPDLVYAGFFDSIARSTDGGRTWTYSTQGLPEIDRVLDLELDPVDPKTLYALTGSSGVFKSTDAGKSWAPVGTGLERLYTETLLLDPRDRSTLYVRTRYNGVLKLTQGAP